MTLTSLRAALVALVLVSSAACGSSGSNSPTAPSTTASAAAAAPALNLAGTWSGTLRDPGNSDPIQVRSWVAAQSGASVSGPLIVVVDADEDGTVSVNTTLAGTVSGSQVVSATSASRPAPFRIRPWPPAPSRALALSRRRRRRLPARWR